MTKKKKLTKKQLEQIKERDAQWERLKKALDASAQGDLIEQIDQRSKDEGIIADDRQRILDEKDEIFKAIEKLKGDEGDE